LSTTTDVSHKFADPRKSVPKILVDGAIRAKSVLVIDGETNEKLGVMPLHEALKKAADKGLNLMQMSPAYGGNPPTCKILDYGKFKYDESKKQKAMAKKQREMQIEEKEMTFKPDTAFNDLKIKAKKVKEFLDNGARVKVSIRCQGRESSHMNVVMDTMNTFMSFLPQASYESLAEPSTDTRVKIIAFRVFNSKSEST